MGVRRRDDGGTDVTRHLGILLAFLLAALPLAARAEVLSTWVEATGGAPSVRVIATGSCPSLDADGTAIPMAVREASDLAFPVISCEADAPSGVAKLSIDGKPVPVWKKSVNRILVLGDTGCRLKGNLVQDCNDPVAWPFATLAKAAAAEKPDLVIHVGDYFYRETPCPEDHAGCAGSPYADAWKAWNADFFDPAKPLLAAAPWIMVRGNHEQCGRGANGWFRFLDPGDKPLTCPAESADYTVSLGALHLYVVDSADTEDATAPADKVKLFRDELDGLEPAMGKGSGWLLTHRPIWGFVPPASGEVGETDELPVNRTEQTAIDGEKLGGLQLILSGHVHLFAAASFGAARPPQLIVGTGGDLRDGDLPSTLR